MKTCRLLHYFAGLLIGSAPASLAFDHSGFYIGNVGIHPDSWIAAVVSETGDVNGILWEPISNTSDSLDLYDSVYSRHNLYIAEDGVIFDGYRQNPLSPGVAIGSVSNGEFRASLEGYPITGKKVPGDGPFLQQSGWYMTFWDESNPIRRGEAIVFPDGQVFIMLRSQLLFGDNGGYAIGELKSDRSFVAEGSQGYEYSGFCDGPVLYISINAYGKIYERILERFYLPPGVSSNSIFEATDNIKWDWAKHNDVWYKQFWSNFTVSDEEFPWVHILNRGWAFAAGEGIASYWLMMLPYDWCWSGYDVWPWMYASSIGWIWTSDELWPIAYSPDHGWLASDEDSWPWVWRYLDREWIQF